MEPKPNFHVAADEAFVDKGVLSSTPETMPTPKGWHEFANRLLSDEVAGLAASLDVTSPGNGDAYEPDAFLRAIHAKHDQLLEIKDRLHEQAIAQKKQAAELAAREAAVSFREKRVLAHEKLLGQQVGGGKLGRRTLWGFFSKT